MDSKVKIWDVFNWGKCMRTCIGHSKVVRDNCCSKFLGVGYDKIIPTFFTRKVPCVVKLNPEEDEQNILFAGMIDKKIVKRDMNTGEIMQEYDQHLGL